MASPLSVLALVGLDSREARVNLLVVLALVAAFGISLLTDPSPVVQAALGVLLVAAILLRTLYAAGFWFGSGR